MSSIPVSKETLAVAFDDCLQNLRAGAPLDVVLSRHPALAAELRPLLETSLAAIAFQQHLTAPPGAQAQSRVRFVNRARDLADRAPSRRFAFRFSPVTLAALIVAGILLALGTGITSAYSKPGDVLYPMKLAGEKTRLLLTTNPVKRLQLQETYDTERLTEVEAVIEQQSTAEVTFSGVLALSDSQEWSVDQVHLILPENLLAQTERYQGKVVEVHGMMTKDGKLAVEEIHLHQLDFKGIVQEMTAGEWTISQVKVKVDAVTAVSGQAQVGDTVLVEVVRQPDQTLRAVHIEIVSPGSNSQQASPGVTPQKAEDENYGEDTNEFAASPTPTKGVENRLRPTPTAEKAVESKKSPTPERQHENEDSTKESPRSATPQPTPTRAKDGSSD